MLSKFNKKSKNTQNTGSTGSEKGGWGDADGEGMQGDPNGKKGEKGTGPGDGPEPGYGLGGPKVSLKGRRVLRPPEHIRDATEEGTVEVKITVDGDGKVIDADPSGKRTNTTSAYLKALARKAAQSTVFNKSADGNIQYGTITFVFELK